MIGAAIVVASALGKVQAMRNVNHSVRAILLSAAVGAGFVLASTLTPAPASAGVNIDINLRLPGDRRVPPPIYGPQPVERVWVEPVYQTTYDRVWAEPVYQTVTNRVWVEPVYQTVNDAVWIPDRYEDRQVVQYSRGRRVIVTQRFLVEPAHQAVVPRQVLVTPGSWQDVTTQQLVGAGGWQNIPRQVLVAPGHWEYVAVPVAPPVVIQPPREPRWQPRDASARQVDVDFRWRSDRRR